MPTRIRLLQLVLVAALLKLPLVASAALATPLAPMTVDPASLVRIDGDSTLHRYHLVTHTLEARITLDPAVPKGGMEEAVRAGKVTALELDIPVADLKSGEGGLDSNFRKALHSDLHPSVTFVMESYRATPDPPPGKGLHLSVQGKLSVNGVERPLTLLLAASPTPAGLQITGTQALSMKEFDVVAPVLMLGTIKTADAVMITWDVLLKDQTR